jgi:hypothetical protein
VAYRLAFFTKVLTAKSAQDTVGAPDPDKLPNIQQLSAYVVFGAGCSSGAVVLEAAHDPAYAGTWAVLATINWAAASRVHIAQVTGLHRAIRLRISTTIGGGTVDGYIMGN